MQTDFFARNTFNVTDLTLDRPWTTDSYGQKGTQATQGIFFTEKDYQQHTLRIYDAPKFSTVYVLKDQL